MSSLSYDLTSTVREIEETNEHTTQVQLPSSGFEESIYGSTVPNDLWERLPHLLDAQQHPEPDLPISHEIHIHEDIFDFKLFPGVVLDEQALAEIKQKSSRPQNSIEESRQEQVGDSEADTQMYDVDDDDSIIDLDVYINEYEYEEEETVHSSPTQRSETVGSTIVIAVSPIAPVQPAAPAQTVDPALLMASAQQTVRAQLAPVQPMAPMQPAAPVRSTVPIQPMAPAQPVGSAEPNAPYGLGRHWNTGKDRCVRCLTQHQVCDGVHPNCGRCAILKRPNCVYPPGRPSRTELTDAGMGYKSVRHKSP